LAGKPRKTIKTQSNIKKECDNCHRELSPTQYYNTNSVLSVDGKLNICKTCLKSMIDPNKIETIYKVLQLLDIPFIYSYYRTAKENNPEDPWSRYITMANSKINEFKKGTWKDSKFEPDSINPVKLNMNQTMISNIHFDVTNEMVLKWGAKYEPEEYYELEQFYNDMQRTNSIETTQDMIYLKKLAIISLKMDKELEEGNYDEAKKLGDLFSKYMADSKFRAMDKTEADKTGGIRNFSSIYMEVEKDGFIPPWEHYRKIKGISQDIVDKTIMHIENFTLKLNKIEKMTSPPSDTPKLDIDEIDNDTIINIKDIEVDENFDNVAGDDL
jgi:hypothetical protein